MKRSINLALAGIFLPWDWLLLWFYGRLHHVWSGAFVGSQRLWLWGLRLNFLLWVLLFHLLQGIRLGFLLLWVGVIIFISDLFDLLLRYVFLAFGFVNNDLFFQLNWGIFWLRLHFGFCFMLKMLLWVFFLLGLINVVFLMHRLIIFLISLRLVVIHKTFG